LATGIDEPPVRFETRGQVAYVTLDRPHVLNALDRRTHEKLAAIWDRFESDDELRVAVLGGAGDRAFSAGRDLKELAAEIRDGSYRPSSFGSAGKPGWPRLTERFDLSKPVVAKVQGVAFGGGFELALACDVIVASETASFALPEVRLGLVPGAGGLFRLTRQLPFKTAMGYLLTGRSMSAARAFELGLVNEIVPHAELDECVGRWVDDLLRAAPLSVRAIKETALRSASMSLEEAFAARYPAEERRMESADAREGPLAFVERRAPRWSGR
jgi:dehydration protein DpgD